MKRIDHFFQICELPKGSQSSADAAEPVAVMEEADSSGSAVVVASNKSNECDDEGGHEGHTNTGALGLRVCKIVENNTLHACVNMHSREVLFWPSKTQILSAINYDPRTVESCGSYFMPFRYSDEIGPKPIT